MSAFWPSFRIDTFPSASCRSKGFAQSCHVLTGLGGYAREREISIHEFAKLETLIHYNFWLHSTFHQERLTCSKFIRCPWRPHLACAMSLDKSWLQNMCMLKARDIQKDSSLTNRKDLFSKHLFQITLDHILQTLVREWIH